MVWYNINIVIENGARFGGRVMINETISYKIKKEVKHLSVFEALMLAVAFTTLMLKIYNRK
ncbi:hypothetical protein LGMS210922A_15020 [Lactococcus garvieae]|nr:hypothetical protein LGMS210922A_15020 [Lactococcus garvieae]BDW51825.1 hypothetical protein LG21E68_15000 [Lactococcus garvieae]